MQMRVPCCSLCHGRYDEEEHTPLLLHCGHGFCKCCLSHMFSASIDTTLVCPRCRHPTVVGNSVLALRKNFPVLSLLASSPSSPSFECVVTDEDEDDDRDDADGFDRDDDDDEHFGGGRGSRWGQELESELEYFGSHRRRRGSHRSRVSVSGRCSGVGGGGSRDSCSAIDLGVHHNIKLLRKVGVGRRPGLEVWTALLSGSSSASSVSSSSPSVRCRHRVAVKRVEITDDMDVVWVQSKLENLRLASMWCRNVCAFHGAIRMDNSLCLVMDRYNRSLQSEMLENKGRLTLEQILRSKPIFPSTSYA